MKISMQLPFKQKTALVPFSLTFSHWEIIRGQQHNNGWWSTNPSVYLYGLYRGYSVRSIHRVRVLLHEHPQPTIILLYAQG